MEVEKNVPPSYADINRLKKRQQIAFRRFMTAQAPSPQVAQYLDCDRAFLREYMNSKMVKGMNWNNYGEKWVVDHIVPMRLFNLFDPEDLRLVWNYRNLMPLFKEDNLHKEGDLRFSLILLDRFDDGSENFRLLKEKAEMELSSMDKYLPVRKLAKAS
ncbi:MAG TPA: hypothetical protein VKU83_06445 [Puia sp.]|nr:hypothetical protein [Puia sp.]